MKDRVLLFFFLITIVVSFVFGYLGGLIAAGNARAEIDAAVKQGRAELLNYSEALKVSLRQAGAGQVEVERAQLPIKVEKILCRLEVVGAEYQYALQPQLNVTVLVKVNHRLAAVFNYTLPTAFSNYSLEMGEIEYRGPWGVRVVEVSVWVSGYRLYYGTFHELGHVRELIVKVDLKKGYKFVSVAFKH